MDNEAQNYFDSLLPKLFMRATEVLRRNEARLVVVQQVIDNHTPLTIWGYWQYKTEHENLIASVQDNRREIKSYANRLWENFPGYDLEALAVRS